MVRHDGKAVPSLPHIEMTVETLREAGVVVDAIREVLDMMGAEVVLDRSGLTVTGGGSILGIDIDLHDSSELTPVVTALTALAESPSIIRGVAHIRGHETDRLAALATELGRIGAVIGLAVPGLVVQDVGTVAKTMPSFTTLWSGMLDQTTAAAQ